MEKLYDSIEDDVGFRYFLDGKRMRKFRISDGREVSRSPQLKKLQKSFKKPTKPSRKSFKGNPIKKLSKGQKWWRSLTLVEQADYRYGLMLRKKGKADWYFEYTQCEKEGHYRKEGERD